MSDQEIERGRRWIEGKLHTVAAEFGVTVSDFAWGPAELPGDYPVGRLGMVPPSEHPLKVSVAGDVAVERFSEDDLEDCVLPGVAGEKKQEELESRIRKLLERTAPRRNRIGF